jgi:hypothetical protein
MTGGGLIQLVAIGEQDLYLTNTPEITFFKTVYRRHSNFSIETIEEVFYNGANFGKTSCCKIQRKGDLINHITLNVKLGSLNKEYFDKINKHQNVVHKR